MWSPIKCRMNPGPLHSHSAVRYENYMFIMGGERPDGSLSDDVWKYHFGEFCLLRVQLNSIEFFLKCKFKIICQFITTRLFKRSLLI